MLAFLVVWIAVVLASGGACFRQPVLGNVCPMAIPLNPAQQSTVGTNLTRSGMRTPSCEESHQSYRAAIESAA
jgi:hypothetical protein